MKKFIPLVGAGAALVILFGTIYAVGQQIQRSDANWPQVQLAEDAAAAIAAGRPATTLAGEKVDMSNSLAPFTNVYDKNGGVVGGNGYLNDAVAKPPLGVLTGSDDQDYHTVTWQPASNVRIAAVTVHAGNYYILSGRSLAIVEKNEARTFLLSFVGGASTLFIVLLTLWSHSLIQRRAARHKR